uniref:Uncharacterized protein n=1 Tax=Timema cristinae TaxID=61476 RepID=A0A7R9CMG0_TIMCR|nr:unnamed protein product [Timema cristinae]
MFLGGSALEIGSPGFPAPGPSWKNQFSKVLLGNVIKRGPAKQGYVHSQLKHWHLTEGFKGKCKTENNFTCGQHFNKEELVSSSKVIRGPKAAARQMYGLIAHMMGHGDLAASCPCGVKDSSNIWVLSVIHLGLIGIWSNDRSPGGDNFPQVFLEEIPTGLVEQGPDDPAYGEVETCGFSY